MATGHHAHGDVVRIPTAGSHSRDEVVAVGMTDEDRHGRTEPAVTVAEDGTRCVSWSIVGSDGVRYSFKHDHPDALRHHYAPLGINEDVPLYRGTFCLDDDDDRPFEGDVRFCWLPTPRVEARGSRETMSEDFLRFLAAEPQTLWVGAATVRVSLDEGRLPAQPPPGDVPPPQQGHSISDRIEQELGSSDELDRVTFLLPNGWQAHDGLGICDPDDLSRLWQGRIETGGDGWTVRIDRIADMDGGQWGSLRDTGGRRFTHVGCLARVDGRPFTGQQAFDALDRVRVALNLALGRRTTCALPVGWRGTDPVWTRWRSAPVDRYATRSHWLDDTIAAHQVGEIVGRVVEVTSDPTAWSVVRPAVAYYMAANVDVDVELSVGIPVSGLQLLAYYRFVTQRGLYSKGKWNELTTAAQLRLLLTDVEADLAVHPHFPHLTAGRDRLAVTGAHRDALGVVMKMRDIVTHPTRDKPADFSVYEWAEAGMHARYWLCLAILHTLGYQGQIADVLGPTPRWTGQVRSVPWAASP